MDITLQLVLDYLAERDPAFARNVMAQADDLLATDMLTTEDRESLTESRNHLAFMQGVAPHGRMN